HLGHWPSMTDKLRLLLVPTHDLDSNLLTTFDALDANVLAVIDNRDFHLLAMFDESQGYRRGHSEVSLSAKLYCGQHPQAGAESAPSPCINQSSHILLRSRQRSFSG